jgi:PAS domain S-box-containing protein
MKLAQRILGGWQAKNGATAPSNYPVIATLIGLSFICGTGWINLVVVRHVDFQLGYLLGCVAVGWLAGMPGALVCALVATSILVLSDAQTRSGSPWIVGFNSILHLLAYLGSGWLAAKLGKTARHLERTAGQSAAWLSKEVAEHKETAELLREGIELFQQVTNNIADVFWVTDPKRTRVEYVSRGFERLWGLTCETFVSSPNTWLQAIHHEDRERVTRAIFSQQVRGEYDEEYRVLHADGSVRWVHDRAFPVKDANGAVYRVVGITEDITERKRSEQLLQAERDIGTTLGSTNDLQFALDRLLEIALQLEGIDCGGVYLMDEKTGEMRLEAHRGLSGSFLKRISHYGAESMETQLARKKEVTYVRHNQIPRGLEVLWGSEGLRALAMVPVRHKDAVLGLLNLGSYAQEEILPRTRAGIEMIAAQVAGTIARLRAEESQRRSEARVRTIINSAPIALLAVDAQGAITLEDGQALQAMGAEAGEHLHRPAVEVYNDFPFMLENIRRALGGEEFSAPLEFASTSFECRFTPLRDEDARPTGFIAVATDVTERSRLERQVLEISDREQARIGQDVHDGLCQQLIGMAFSANSLEQSLKNQGRPEAATAGRICRLLHEAIDESRRVARGLYPIRLTTEGLLPALEELAHSTNERFGVSCVCETEAEIPRFAVARATHLYRIAQEAVNNAVKHSGARHIGIRMARSDGQVVLEISDDGKGIGQPSTEGSGMGLHIMGYRARLLGGSLEVRAKNPGTIVSCRVTQSA